MKRKLALVTALLLTFALLLPLAACGKADVPANAQESEAPAETTQASEEPGTTLPAEDSTAPEEEPTEASPVPGTPAEILAAYTEVMNTAKKDVKSMRKLEYQFLDKDKMSFELDVVNTPGVLDWVNNNLMTTKEKGLQQDQYTKGVTDMALHLPVMHTPVGCMVKDTGVFTRTAAKQLPNGNIELTLVMKPEDNPEPAKEGATSCASRTGQMFNPLSKAGIDDLQRKARIFITTKLDFSLRYYDCKSVLVYNPETMQAVSLRQDYYVKINVANGKVLFINAKGSGVLEAATICDNFKY